MSIKLTNENFETEVLKSDKPVLIDFYADWCGPCKMSAPHVEAIAEEKAAAKYGVMSIPTFIFIKDGEVLTKSVGAKNKDELLALAGL